MTDHFLIDATQVATLDRLARRLYTEDRLTGDDMRNAAQALDAIVRVVRDLPVPTGEETPASEPHTVSEGGTPTDAAYWEARNRLKARVVPASEMTANGGILTARTYVMGPRCRACDGTGDAPELYGERISDRCAECNGTGYRA